MAGSKIERMKKDELKSLSPFRLGEPNPDAAERAREIKRRQKERGVVYSDSSEIVRAYRNAR